MELHRQRVLDLATAQSAAERLTDYTFESTLNKKSQTNAPNTSGMKPFKPNQTKSGGGDRRPPTFREHAASKASSSNSNYNSNAYKPRPIACFLCNGPHRVAECPQRIALNALQASLCPQRQEKEENVEEEEEEPTSPISQEPERKSAELSDQGKTATDEEKKTKGRKSKKKEDINRNFRTENRIHAMTELNCRM